jgi:hypothetical protein
LWFVWDIAYVFLQHALFLASTQPAPAAKFVPADRFAVAGFVLAALRRYNAEIVEPG